MGVPTQNEQLFTPQTYFPPPPPQAWTPPPLKGISRGPEALRDPGPWAHGHMIRPIGCSFVRAHPYYIY